MDYQKGLEEMLKSANKMLETASKEAMKNLSPEQRIEYGQFLSKLTGTVKKAEKDPHYDGKKEVFDIADEFLKKVNATHKK